MKKSCVYERETQRETDFADVKKVPLFIFKFVFSSTEDFLLRT